VRVVGIDHIQLAMPADAEAEARAFYGRLLGFEEIAKPPALATRGGIWFRCGSVELHLGVDPAFHPVRMAHPAFVVDDLDELVRRLRGADLDVAIDTDSQGRHRSYVADPFGNRLEFIAD